MGKIALEYTLIGMGTVFLILIFLSCIIGLFKFISPKKKEGPAVQTAEPVQETKEEQDDGQLIAVIAAALKAYMDEQGKKSSDYVVRSIRRR